MLTQAADLRGALERSRAELENLLTIPIERGVAVTVPPYPQRDIAEVESLYLTGSHLAAQRRAEVESARAQVAVRQGGMLPKLALRLERLAYQNQGNAALANNDTRVMLVLQFAPEAGLASYSGYQAAGSRVDAALAQLAADENDIRLRARTNWADYNSTRQQVNELEPQVAAIEAASASYTRQFEAGRKSWLDVLNTHRETIESRLALSRARTTRDQASTRLMINTAGLGTWLEAQPR
jgi:adhesin transport system outer membrane protein